MGGVIFLLDDDMKFCNEFRNYFSNLGVNVKYATTYSDFQKIITKDGFIAQAKDTYFILDVQIKTKNGDVQKLNECSKSLNSTFRLVLGDKLPLNRLIIFTGYRQNDLADKVPEEYLKCKYINKRDGFIKILSYIRQQHLKRTG